MEVSKKEELREETEKQALKAVKDLDVLGTGTEEQTEQAKTAKLLHDMVMDHVKQDLAEQELNQKRIDAIKQRQAEAEKALRQEELDWRKAKAQLLEKAGEFAVGTIVYVGLNVIGFRFEEGKSFGFLTMKNLMRDFPSPFKKR